MVEARGLQPCCAGAGGGHMLRQLVCAWCAKRVCGCRASAIPNSSESNPTSLPVDVESDGNIFCSQNVAVVFSMLFCFVSCISMVPTLPREEKCS